MGLEVPCEKGSIAVAPILPWEHVWFNELPVVTQTQLLHLPLQCTHSKSLSPLLIIV